MTQNKTIQNAELGEAFDPQRYPGFNSYVYRRKVKRMVQMVKALRGITTWAKPANQLKKNATDEARMARSGYEVNRIGSDLVHFFAQPSVKVYTEGRKEKSEIDQVLTEVAPSMA